MMNRIIGNILYVAVAMVLSVSAAFGQARNVTVSGIVTDENGQPLPGASVMIEGTTTGQVTDLNGKYRIRALSNQTLVFSFIGYEPKSYVSRNNRTLDVTLFPDTKLLDEVVVVGYGTMKRSDLTGAVASVSSKSLERFRTPDVMNALGGMVAGVNVTATDGGPGAEFDIKVRGVGSVTGATSPLYIVDGFEVDDINYLSKQDIKSIEILKDASASAIYGARAANGVVLVTTKEGRQGQAEVSYNGSATYRILANTIDLMSPYDFVGLQVEMKGYDSDPSANPYYKEGNDKDGNPYRYQTWDDYKDAEGVNWQTEAFRPAWAQSHDVSVSGGSQSTQYLASFSHSDEDGMFLGTSYVKTNARLKLNQKIFKWLTFNASVDYSNTRNEGVGNVRSVMTNLLRYRPIGGLKTTDHELRYNTEDLIAQETGSNETPAFNPLVNAENTISSTRRDRWGANGSLLFRFNKYLSFKTSASFSIQTSRIDKFYKNGTSSADRGTGPYGNSKYLRNLRWGVTNQLTYNRTFYRKHKVNAIIGQESAFNGNESIYAEAKVFSNDQIGPDNLGLGAVPSAASSSRTEKNSLSFFARAFYSYDSRYMLTATVRADASSVFARNNKWGCFPSFSAAWDIRQESWMKDNSNVSNLKLRAGWGMVGNDKIANYLSLKLYDAEKYGLGEQQTIVYNSSHLPNPDLKWEAAMTTNVGIDAGFFDNRLNLTLDGFIKDSRDLLLDQDLSMVSGFKTQKQNVGKIRNMGVEFSVNSINIDRKNFSWATDFNISFIRNELVSLDNGKSYMLSNSGFNSSYTAYDYISYVGQPLGNMYGYVFDGVYQYSDFMIHADGTWHLRPGVADISEHAGIKPGDFATRYPGFVKYKDLDGDGKITTADRTVIGNAQPDLYGGITNSFYIYGVDLSFMFQFSIGNDVYNAQRMVLNQTDISMKNAAGEVRNRWTPVNASNNVPSVDGIIRHDVYSRFIEDGSFLRMKNLTIGYTVPQKYTHRVFISKLRIYASAENLFVLTRYSGYDPEVNYSTEALTPGVDYGSYPKSRAFTFGVELNF